LACLSTVVTFGRVAPHAGHDVHRTQPCLCAEHAKVDFWCLLVVYGLCWWFLARSKGRRTLFAIGSNAEAARAAGLSIAYWSVLAYALSGVMSAMAAIFPPPKF
jgi:ribose/xylose/arabinose/galactoside ABC-type transport system permease subunit